VPRCGNGEEDEGAGDGVKFAEAREGASEAVDDEEIEGRDGEWEDDADEALGEDVEGAAGGEGVAEKAVVCW